MKDIDALLKSVKRIHFIGIGGSGMCPIAAILHKEGYLLSGSDNNETDTLARIRSLGIPVVLGQKELSATASTWSVKRANSATISYSSRPISP